jgi:hypothetical protein
MPVGTSRIESTQITWFPDNQAGRLHEQWPKATQGGPSGWSPLRSDGSCEGQAGRLERVSSGQASLKGDYQARVHLGQMVLVVGQQGG